MPSQPLNRQDMAGLISGFVVADQPTAAEKARRAAAGAARRITDEANAARDRAAKRIDAMRAAGAGQAHPAKLLINAAIISGTERLGKLPGLLRGSAASIRGLIAKVPARASIHGLRAKSAALRQRLPGVARKAVLALNRLHESLPARPALPASRLYWLKPKILDAPRLGLLHVRLAGATIACSLFAAFIVARAPAPPEAAPDITASIEPQTDARASLAWIDIRRPIAQFALDSAELSKIMQQQGARRHPAGGREEYLIWGNPVEPGLYSQIAVYRPGGEARNSPTLFVDVARRAALSGLSILRSSAPQPAESKFGPLETAEIQLGSTAGERACLAFRRSDTDAKLHLSGWYCGPDEKPADRLALRCFVDRLSLIRSGEDTDLRALFAAAERSKSPCAGAKRQTGTKTTWLDAESKPPSLKLAEAKR